MFVYDGMNFKSALPLFFGNHKQGALKLCMTPFPLSQTSMCILDENKDPVFPFFYYLFNQDLLHARLNSHYEAWSYKKRSTKKIAGYGKSVYKEPIVKRCLLILDLKPLRSQVKGKHSIGREFQTLAMRGKKPLTQTSL